MNKHRSKHHQEKNNMPAYFEDEEIDTSLSVKCHDCGVEEGQFHEPGCDQERCPLCCGQLITCNCVYNILGYHINHEEPYWGLPKRVYEEGLNDEEIDKWNEILNRKGLIPHIFYPNICARCGKVNPRMFRVPNNVWEKYIRIDKRKELICQDCFEKIKNFVDKADPNHAINTQYIQIYNMIHL